MSSIGGDDESRSMTPFSSLLSSLKGQPQAPKPATGNASRPATSTQEDRKPNGVTDRYKLTPNNTAAGVKRRSEEPESNSRSNKLVKTEQNGLPSRPATAGNRFQLSAKPAVVRTASPGGQRAATTPSSSASPAKATSKVVPRPGVPGAPAASASTAAKGTAKKTGFAFILEKGKAATEAAKASAAGGIKHKPAEKMTMRERKKLREEQLAAQKAGNKGLLPDRSRSGTPIGILGSAGKKGLESTYRGTMKKPVPEPLAYKGTMRPAGSVEKPPPRKGAAQDKYGGYASWSDLEDAEQDAEQGYYDDSDDDMEGGFDEMEAEENAALRVARKEDQEALEEEERLRTEKSERNRRLAAMNKEAAAKKRY